MDKLRKILQEIGLSEKEANVYLVTLQFPNQPISTIAKKIGMNRGTAFVIYHELLQKGLVKKSIAKDVQRFTSVSPEDVVEYLEKKAFLLGKQKEKVEAMLPEFKMLEGVGGAKPVFQFFEGREGIQKLLFELLRAPKRSLAGIISHGVLSEKLGKDILVQFERERVAMDTSLKLLLSFDEHHLREFADDDTKKREVRYLPEPLSFPMSLLYWEKQAILISHEEEYGLLIGSHEYVAMHKTFFETLWAISKKEVIGKDFRMPLV